MSNYLPWLDIETTGLDERKDFILEVGICITDLDLNVKDHKSWVIADHFVPFQQVFAQAGPYVQAMHEKSGLWAAIRAEREAPATLTGLIPSMPTVEQQALNCLDSWFEPDFRPPMCGSSIGFDRKFLSLWMRNLDQRFAYRNIDVSSIKELAERWAPEVWDSRPGQGEDQKEHRPLGDLLASIAELRHYVDSDFIRPTRLLGGSHG